jgi:hypothetical protein
MKPFLSRAECNALKGLAILGIVLHNYSHWLGFAIKENEYQWQDRSNVRLIYELHFPGHLTFVQFLSYFGHYGVPVFLFLSGLGLVFKYEQTNSAPVRTLPFLRYHYLKLFRLMIFGFVAFTMLDAITPSSHQYQFIDVIGQLGLFNNLLPDPSHVIWPGPFWFFGLMMQLYLIYRLFIYRRHWGFIVALMVICVLSQVFCAPSGDTLEWIRYNMMGGMVPFGLGILAARYLPAIEWNKNIWALTVLILIPIIYFMCLSYQSWFWVPVFIIAINIAFIKVLPSFVTRYLLWIGGISAAMFVTHPILRKIFIPISRSGDVYTGILLYLVATIVVAWLYHKMLTHIPKPHLHAE